jgi:hypothetical protein
MEIVYYEGDIPIYTNKKNNSFAKYSDYQLYNDKDLGVEDFLDWCSCHNVDPITQ